MPQACLLQDGYAWERPQGAAAVSRMESTYCEQGVNVDIVLAHEYRTACTLSKAVGNVNVLCGLMHRL